MNPHLLAFIGFLSIVLLATGLGCGLVAAWLSFRPVRRGEVDALLDDLDAYAASREALARLHHLDAIGAAEFRDGMNGYRRGA